MLPKQTNEVGMQRTFAEIACLRYRLVKVDQYKVWRSLNAMIKILYTILSWEEALFMDMELEEKYSEGS